MMITKIKNKIEEWGFTGAHALLMSCALIVFVILISPHLNLSFKTLTTKADNHNKEILTYEQVRAEVYAESKLPEEDAELAALVDKQFALLDRNADAGEVLGESIGFGDVPDATEFLTPDLVDQSQIKVLADSSQSALVDYRNNLQIILGEYEVFGMLAALNSSDTTTLSELAKKFNTLASHIISLEVPAPLVDYHKYNVAYYNSLANVAMLFAGQTPDVDMQFNTKAMLSLSQKIDQLKTELEKSYGLQL